jgi:hypothetical protein
MKIIATLAVIAAMTLGVAQSHAQSNLVLYLTSISGSITATDSYGTNTDTTTSPAKVGAVNLKKILTLVSNEVFLKYATNTPANAKIAYDPYAFVTFLTNSSGFYQNLSNIMSFTIYDIATTFHGSSNNSGSENDKIIVYLDVHGTGPDGYSYEFALYGQGGLTASLNGTTGKAKMSISLSNGGDYGELQNSVDGASKGSFTLSGSGVPAVNEPYSVYWWNYVPPQ